MLHIKKLKSWIIETTYNSKKYIFVIKRDGKVVEERTYEAYGRDYARRLADMIEVSENCTIIVKIKNDEKYK